MFKREGSKKRRTLSLAIILAGLLTLSPNALLLHSQTESQKSRLDKQFLSNLGADFREVIASPLRWKGADVVKLVAVLGTGALLYVFDEDVYDWIQERRSSTSVDMSQYISKLGNGAYLTGFLAGLYVSGEIAGEDSLRKTALLSLESFLATSVFVLGLKFITGRARPQSGELSRSFHFFSVKTAHTSFPSGDSAAAFAVATTIAEQSQQLSVDMLAYSLATLVALYRVHDQKHWVSDVFIGSSLGYFVAKKISALNRNRSEQKIRLSFQVSPGRQVFSLSYCF